MTIAIGVICRDAVVVGADQEISLATTKIERRKAHVLKRTALQIGLVGAGTYDLINRAKQDIDSHLQDRQSADDVRAVVEAVVRKIDSDLISRDPNHSVDLLIGIKTDTELKLLKVEPRHNSAPSFVWVEDNEAIGYGYELAHYVLAQLYGSPLTLSSERGVIITAHALKVAKDRVQGCGGRSDIMMLKRGFHAYEVPEKDLVEHERSAQRITEIMRPVMLALTDLDVRPNQLENLIGTMSYELNQFRSNDFIQRQIERFRPLAIEIPSEGISIRGLTPTVLIRPSTRTNPTQVLRHQRTKTRGRRSGQLSRPERRILRVAFLKMFKAHRPQIHLSRGDRCVAQDARESIQVADVPPSSVAFDFRVRPVNGRSIVKH